MEINANKLLDAIGIALANVGIGFAVVSLGAMFFEPVIPFLVAASGVVTSTVLIVAGAFMKSIRLGENDDD
ncbi:MAG: hypothetical protein RJQ08_10760 [Salinisphaeraceae bacterium]